jgi:hypothetical protein
MLLHQGTLYLAGGTSVSPGIYDAATGRCLNDPTQLKECASIYPRGWELSLLGDTVIACGQPFYKHPDLRVFDPSAVEKIMHTPGARQDIVWNSNKELLCYRPIDKDFLTKSIAARARGFMIPPWGKLKVPYKPLWRHACPNSRAIAICKNGVVVAGESAVTALDIRTGGTIWELPLPGSPVPWGMAVDRSGRTVVTMRDGRVLCIGR